MRGDQDGSDGEGRLVLSIKVRFVSDRERCQGVTVFDGSERFGTVITTVSDDEQFTTVTNGSGKEDCRLLSSSRTCQ